MSYMSWLLHAVQQPHSQTEPSPHLQCHKEELLHYVMPEHQDFRSLQSPTGGGHKPISHISPLQFYLRPCAAPNSGQCTDTPLLFTFSRKCQSDWNSSLRIVLLTIVALINISLFLEPHSSNKCIQVLSLITTIHIV